MSLGENSALSSKVDHAIRIHSHAGRVQSVCAIHCPFDTGISCDLRLRERARQERK